MMTDTGNLLEPCQGDLRRDAAACVVYLIACREPSTCGNNRRNHSVRRQWLIIA